MRISDWSSDVCSSDLPCREDAPMSDAASGLALGITRSIAGQPWHWRRASADMRDEGGRENLAPDDLVTQLLLARGVSRGDPDRQRTPTRRGFMPDQTEEPRLNSSHKCPSLMPSPP